MDARGGDGDRQAELQPPLQKKKGKKNKKEKRRSNLQAARGIPGSSGSATYRHAARGDEQGADGSDEEEETPQVCPTCGYED